MTVDNSGSVHGVSQDQDVSRPPAVLSLTEPQCQQKEDQLLETVISAGQLYYGLEEVLSNIKYQLFCFISRGSYDLSHFHSQANQETSVKENKNIKTVSCEGNFGNESKC